jgi:LuxR family maltose regulon positive regulatory protein
MARAQAFAETASGIAQQLHSASWIRKTDDLLRQIDPEFHGASTNAARQAEEETFSSRELEVLQLLKSELNGPEIAERLVVSLNTVRYHTKNIYRKLGANTRLEAIQRAKEFGL